MTINNKLDNRQSRQRAALDQVSNETDLRLDTILNLVNDELTPPLRLRADIPGTRYVYIDSYQVQTADGSSGHKRNKSIPPLQDKIPSFTGGNFQLPSTSGGNITGSVFPVGVTYTLNITSGFFRKMIVSLDSDGKIVLSFGTTESVTESLASIPASDSSTFPIGIVVLKNEGGTIRNVSSEHIYQFTGNTNAGADANIVRVNKSNHNFVIGDVLYYSGSQYEKALATVSNTSNVVGMVSKIVDTNNFELTTDGRVVGSILAENAGVALTPGSKYFLSDSTAGRVTTTAPTVVGRMRVELGQALGATSFAISPKLGIVVGSVYDSPNLRTQVNLTGSSSVESTTVIQNVSGYDGGELVGFVTLDANTDYKFYVQAQFIKNSSNIYDMARQVTGDTPPLGFSITITPAGVIQIILPTMDGWVSGNIVYALNAPAIGTSFPLTVNTSNITTNYREVTSAYSLTINDYMVVASGSSTYSLTLPIISGSGVSYIIKSNMNSGIGLTVNRSGSDTFGDGTISKALSAGEVLKITSSSNKWIITDFSQDIAAVSSPSLTGAKITGLTASRAVQADASKNLVSAPFALPVGAGSLLQILSSGGDGTSSWVTRPKIRTQTFTSNGNWTCPAGVDTVLVFGCGGGGGGGGAQSSSQGPQGGGGSGFQSYISSTIPGQLYSIIIGVGGSGGGSSGFNASSNGGNGGSSSFGSSVTFLGGKGGRYVLWIPNGTAGGGDGGAGSDWEPMYNVSSWNTRAQDGQRGFNSEGGSGGANYSSASGGGGGGGYTGSGGHGAYTVYTGYPNYNYFYYPATNGTGYGSGGGGGGTNYSTGGNGSSGIVIVCWVE